MTDYLLVIYPIALLVIYIFGCEISKGGSFNEDCLSKKQSKMMQAIVCLFVVLHHLTQEISGYGDLYRGPVTILSSMGILFTSIFFFFSGYGLIVSVKSNNEYLDNFLKHRFSTVLVPFITANVIAVLIRIFYVKMPMTPMQIAQCVSGYVLINGNGWYIVEIVFIYLAFYIIFKTVKNKRAAIILLCVFVGLLIYTGYSNGHDFSTLGNHWFKGEWWYNSTIVFIQGVLFACLKDRITALAKKYYRLLLPAHLVLFVLCFYVEEIIRKRYGYYNNMMVTSYISSKLATLIAQMILCIVFTNLVILVHMKVRTGNRILEFVSSISMEIFLIHGLFINYIFDVRGKNEFVYFAMVIAGGVVAAIVVHAFDIAVIRAINGFKRNNKEYLKDCGIDLIRERKQKRIKRILNVVYIIAAASTLFLLVINMILLPAEGKKEIEIIKNSKVYDTVRFGRYEIEPAIPFNERVEWIVVEKETDRALLVSKIGIEGNSYNKKHEEVSFEESDVFRFMNDEMFEKLFSGYEKEFIISDPDTGGYLSLMTVEEVRTFFKDDLSRQLQSSTYAKKKGVNVNTPSKIDSWDYKDYRASWWWLRGEKSITAPIVTPEGSIETDTKYVNKPNGAIRPVVWVKW